jgi:hypothetical protein
MKSKILRIKCECGCLGELQIFNDQDMIHIDIRDSKKSRWHGIVIEDTEKIQKFFERK